MEKNFGIGVVGCGGIANGAHLPPLSKAHGAHIAALCDINPQALRDTAQKYGIDAAHCFADYRDLIACPDVDAVEVCTPNLQHCPIASAALRAGKPVNVEKPVGMSADEVHALNALAAEVGLPGMVCFSYRFMPAVRYAKELIDAGRIGRIVSIYAQYLKSSAYMPGRRLDWRFDASIAGCGVSGDLGAHVVDMIRFLAGDFDTLAAQTGIAVKQRKKLDSEELAPVTTDDFCHFLANLKSGVPAVFTISRCAQGNGNHIIVDIYGDRGAIRFDLNCRDQLQLLKHDDDALGRRDGEMETVQVPEGYGVSQEQSFVDLLHGRAPRWTPTLADGAAVQQVLDAIGRSAAARAWVKL